MHVVINHLTVSRPPSPEVVADLQDRALAEALAIEGIRRVELVQVDEHHLVMLIHGESPAALAQLSEQVGSPWVSANLGPLFTEPPNRVVGEVLASSDRPES
jgi:hypothetical protein